MGIYYYGARWYDSSLGRWISPDSIIPAQQGVMGNDRYAYVNNSPVKYTDPTGHKIVCPPGEGGCDYDEADAESNKNQQPNSLDYPAIHENEDIGMCTITYTCKEQKDVITNSEVLSTLSGWTYDVVVTYLKFISSAWPMYRPIKGIIPTGGWAEGIAGGSFQFTSDLDDDFTINQRLGRAIVAGIESAATDVSSASAGAFTAGTTSPTTFGALALGAVGSFITDRYMDDKFWPSINDWLFPLLGFGDN